MLTKGPHKVGLRALFETAGLSGKTIDSYHIAFMVAPRINAAGRMSTPDIATRLLLAADDGMGEEARALAEQLETENTEPPTGRYRTFSPRRKKISRPIPTWRADRSGRGRRRLARRGHRHRRLEDGRSVVSADDRAVGRRRDRAWIVPQHSRLRHARGARIMRAADDAIRRSQGSRGPAARTARIREFRRAMNASCRRPS